MVKGEHTSEETTQALMAFAVATGEKPLGYDLIKAIYDQGRYGKSVGHGFYDYE